MPCQIFDCTYLLGDNPVLFYAKYQLNINNNQSIMNFSTEMTPTNIEILQSVLYNTEKDISKIQLTLDFDDEEKYKRFIAKYAPTSNEDQDILNSSDSEDDEQLEVERGMVNADDGMMASEQSHTEKLSRLELSIVLKQNYQTKIDEIAKNTNVRILIVPQKLKYFGHTYADIEQANSQVHQIKININIDTLSQSGREIYESNYLRERLNKTGIKLGRLAEKYYYWYNTQECDEKEVENILQQVLHRSKHLFYPLLENYENLGRRFNQKYITALIKNNGKLYKQYLEPNINDDKSDHKVELNLAQTELIIHIPVLEQAEIIKNQIKVFYANHLQFFVHYKIGEVDGQTYNQEEDIPNLAEIEKTLEQNGIIWSKHKDLLVINFTNKNIRVNDTILNTTTVMENAAKEFLQNLKPVFKLNTNCSIEILGEEEQNEAEPEGKLATLHKKITKEYKKYDGIISIAPKSQRPELLQQIVEQFILKPKLSKPAKPNKIVNESSLSLSHINPQGSTSNMIHDTTSIVENQNSYSNILNNNMSVLQNGNENQQKASNDNKLLEGIKQNTVFKNYSFLFKDVHGEKKYYEDPDQVKKGKMLLSSEREIYENILLDATNHKYTLYSVALPVHKKVSFDPDCSDLVTIFVRDSDKQYFGKDILYVYLMVPNSKNLATNGWLLNIRKSDIKQNSYKYEVEKGKYEIIMFIKYIGQR